MIISHFKFICQLMTALTLLYVMCHVLIMEPICMNGIPIYFNYHRYNGTGNEPPTITIVTAFFNLGDFRKGDTGNSVGPGQYKKWASVYKYMHNPVVFYTDSDQFAEMFTNMRSALRNMTKVIKIDRNDLWAFKWVDRIREIYSDPSYPKLHPNTIVPEYSCVQHAKYDCVEDAILKDYFSTKYVMWLDIGYFRSIVERKRHFLMTFPQNFDDGKIALNQILHNSLRKSPYDIFRKSELWVGGGLVLGEKSLFVKFIQVYHKAVERYLDMNLSSTDQQVLFSMYTEKEKEILKPVDFQIYRWDVLDTCWFYLGYQCYKELQD